MRRFERSVHCCLIAMESWNEYEWVGGWVCGDEMVGDEFVGEELVYMFNVT